MTIQQEKGLGHFGWLGFGVEAVSAHLTLAVTGHAVRIQRQESAIEMTSGAAQFAQGDLQLLSLLDSVAGQKVVDGHIGGNEGEAVGQFKTLLGERPPLPVRAQAHGGFIDQVQGQTRLDSLLRQARPGTHEIPSAEAQVLGQ